MQTNGNFYVYEYPRPLAAATMCYVFANKGKPLVLLVKRKETSEAYPGMWCFPGGFLEVGKETLEQCASREMKEETQVIVYPSQWTMFMTQSHPKDDPRGHMINTVFRATNFAQKPPVVVASDDAVDYIWCDMSSLINMQLAFKHNDIANKLFNQFNRH